MVYFETDLAHEPELKRHLNVNHRTTILTVPLTYIAQQGQETGER